ncbi:hypothetical protein SANTM175S_04243 [Streptomyces antimycoticus]
MVSKSEIVQSVWDTAYDGGANLVEVYIRSLRRKIDVPYGRQMIRTIRGAGYLLARDRRVRRSGASARTRGASRMPEPAPEDRCAVRTAVDPHDTGRGLSPGPRRRVRRWGTSARTRGASRMSEEQDIGHTADGEPPSAPDAAART